MYFFLKKGQHRKCCYQKIYLYRNCRDFCSTETLKSFISLWIAPGSNMAYPFNIDINLSEYVKCKFFKIFAFLSLKYILYNVLNTKSKYAVHHMSIFLRQNDFTLINFHVSHLHSLLFGISPNNVKQLMHFKRYIYILYLNYLILSHRVT